MHVHWSAVCQPLAVSVLVLSKWIVLQAASGAAQAEREAGSTGTHDSIAASAAAGVKAATEGK